MEKPKLPGVITAEYLEGIGACQGALEFWRERWPDGAPLNDATISEAMVASLSFVHWAHGLLRAWSFSSDVAQEALERDKHDAYRLREKLYALIPLGLRASSVDRYCRLIRALCPSLRESTIREHFDVVDGATSV